MMNLIKKEIVQKKMMNKKMRYHRCGMMKKILFKIVNSKLKKETSFPMKIKTVWMKIKKKIKMKLNP